MSADPVASARAVASIPFLDAAAMGDVLPTVDLRLRAPASAVITETLRLQAGAPAQSRMARIFGQSPLTAESRSWYLGALGELEVGRVLDRLGPDWTVIHAVPVGAAGSDIDHLVIGPGGVYTVNTKRHQDKKVWVGGRTLLVNGQRTDHLRNASHESRRASKLLSAVAGATVEVRPMIAVVGARSITVRGAPEVTVLSAGQLARWLTRRPAVLPSEQAARLVEHAQAPRTWGAQHVEPADLNAFARLRERVASAYRRRIGWTLALVVPPSAALLTWAGIVGVGAFVGPGL